VRSNSNTSHTRRQHCTVYLVSIWSAFGCIWVVLGIWVRVGDCLLVPPTGAGSRTASGTTTRTPPRGACRCPPTPGRPSEIVHPRWTYNEQNTASVQSPIALR
jgi:hypothetical protein